jgi:TIR domain
MSASQDSANPEVFVSYASHDRERVMTVASNLRSHEVSLWLDQHRIVGGASWAREIVQAIRSCKVLLLMCSDAAMRSRAVAQEIQLAWKYQLGYLPLLLERTSFPEQVEFFLEGCQWIEVLDRPIEQWLADVLGALQNAGVLCSTPVHQGSSEESRIRPRRPLAGLEGLWSLAKFTDRIWPLVVEGRSSAPQSVTYEVREYGAPQPGVRHKIRLGSSVFWAIEWETSAHLLLLNHGSEEKTYCLCPSWFAPGTRLRPGVNLFPLEEAHCEPFVLTGIPGRESVLAIITDEPLGLDWMTADRSIPARVLDRHDLLELGRVLSNLRPDHWAVLATDFDVVD